MSTKSLVAFFLRTTPPAMWFYFIPVLIFLVPWISWIGDGRTSGLDITVLTSPGNIFSLIAGITYLYSTNTRAEWGLPTRLPYAEFLVSRPLERLRLCAVSLAIFQVIVLGPMLLTLGITAFKPDMKFLLFRSAEHSTQASERQEVYEKNFPSSYVEPGKNTSTLVVPGGLLYVKLWQLAILALVTVAVQSLLLGRARDTRMGRLLIQVPIFLFVAPTLLFVFRREWIMPAVESSFFFFIQHLAPSLLVVAAAFVAMQVWTLRQARDLEVL